MESPISRRDRSVGICDGSHGGMGLVERDGEIRAVVGMARDCVRGVGGVMCVTGPPGSGKTALIDLLRDHVSEIGAHCITATCSRMESTLPLGVIQQLFMAASLDRADADKVEELLDEGMTMISAAPGGLGQIG